MKSDSILQAYSEESLEKLELLKSRFQDLKQVHVFMDSNLQVLQKIKEYGVTYVNDDNYLNSVNYLLDYFRDLSDYLVDNQELQGILEDMEKTLNRILNG